MAEGEWGLDEFLLVFGKGFNEFGKLLVSLVESNRKVVEDCSGFVLNFLGKLVKVRWKRELGKDILRDLGHQLVDLGLLLRFRDALLVDGNQLVVGFFRENVLEARRRLEKVIGIYFPH